MASSRPHSYDQSTLLLHRRDVSAAPAGSSSFCAYPDGQAQTSECAWEDARLILSRQGEAENPVGGLVFSKRVRSRGFAVTASLGAKLWQHCPPNVEYRQTGK